MTLDVEILPILLLQLSHHIDAVVLQCLKSCCSAHQNPSIGRCQASHAWQSMLSGLTATHLDCDVQVDFP